MANYCCAVRTNYFHVKDPDAFLEFMDKVAACEDSANVWEDRDKAGRPVFGFGCYSPILGVPARSEEACVDDDDFEDYDYDEFVSGLSELVAEDDAIIILESGNEKLRYLIGSALVITSTGADYMEIDAIAAKRAAEMIGNPGWQTKTCY